MLRATTGAQRQLAEAELVARPLCAQRDHRARRGGVFLLRRERTSRECCGDATIKSEIVMIILRLLNVAACRCRATPGGRGAQSTMTDVRLLPDSGCTNSAARASRGPVRPPDMIVGPTRIGPRG